MDESVQRLFGEISVPNIRAIFDGQVKQGFSPSLFLLLLVVLDLLLERHWRWSRVHCCLPQRPSSQAGSITAGAAAWYLALPAPLPGLVRPTLSLMGIETVLCRCRTARRPAVRDSPQGSQYRSLA